MDANHGNTWTSFPIGQYPYASKPVAMPATHIDRYKRNVASLVSSLGKLFNQVTRSILPDYTIVEIKRAGRMCNNVMTMDDYLHFFAKVSDEPTRNSLIVHLDLLQEDETRYLRQLSNLSQYDDIILSTASSSGKPVLLFITPSQDIIDVFCITPVQFDDMNDPLQSLILLLSQSCGRTFSIGRCLQIPNGFHPDPLFMALFLTATMDRHGHYFETTANSLLRFKLWILGDFITLHDTYLGRLSLDDVTTYSHPFHTPRRKQDNFDKLEKKGWFVMDVKGDGNCGYYALFLALENAGINEFYIDTKNNSPRVARGRWQRQVLALRQRLAAGSHLLLTQVFPTGSPNRQLPWWTMDLGAPDTESQNDLCSSFLIPNNDDISLYFNDDFTENEEMHHYHMNPFWAATVIAYVFQVRVIIITLLSQKLLNLREILKT